MAFAGDKKFGQSLLHRPETWLKKQLLPWVPSWLETYHLTATTVLWGLLVIAFAFLSRYNMHFMWGASAMIFAQYITDLLDGAVGRERDTGLVKWGYYMDHFLDFYFLCCMMIGYALLVPQQFVYILVFVLALFGCFMVNSFLAFSTTNKFQISYFGIGPTEVRLVFIAVNALLVLYGRENLTRALPYVLGVGTFGLFVTVYRTQEKIWQMDMEAKYPDGLPTHPDAPADDGAATLPARVKKRHIAAVAVSMLIGAAAILIWIMRMLYPYHRVVAAAVYAAGWVIFLAACWNYRVVLRRYRVKLRRGVRAAMPYVLAAVALGAMAYVAVVLVPVRDSELTRLSAGDLRAVVDADLDRLRRLRRACDLTTARLQQTLDDDTDLAALGRAEKQTLRRRWHRCVDAWVEFDAFRERYRGFYQIDNLTQPELHADAFYLAYAALAKQYALARELLALVGDRAPLTTFLDEPAAGHPPATVTGIKQWLHAPNTVLRLKAGQAYQKLVAADMTAGPAATKALEQDVQAATGALTEQPGLVVDSALDVLERKALKAWLPVQKELAVRASHVRTSSRAYAVTPTQIAACRDRLLPGDIMLQRRTWHMSNVGIPGFWTHAALYIGTLDEMRQQFDGLPALGGLSVDAYLDRRFPRAFRQLQKADERGYRRCVIEAKRPGVILTALEHSGNADHVAVVRVDLNAAARLRVVLAALTHYGKPYDYNFDFASDSALVCSELVCKAYTDCPAVDFDAGQVSGRLMLSPNELARKFDHEYDSDGQQLRFVLFLDADPDSGRAHEQDAAAFRASWQRSKWDILRR